ncbi:glutamate receptor 2.2-like [Mangifera indica]|uniref:glutamate receptor 2.2-like n=1 Tax=Mangifera indica TaxID=29780 RepID=UPI001CF95DFD|nr:glutamate receptor 2.2-like [Mangifera indica]
MALAMAVEKAGTTNFGFNNTNVLANATDLEALGVSKNGPKLLESLSGTFRGLTGDYTFVDGQLQSLAFQIVNVNGDGARGTGFWTPEGVPVKNRYSDFVKVTTDPSTKTTTVTGCCIDVLNAVMQVLPYAISYEFIPFALPNGFSAGSYNDMIYQVKLWKFDAVVADTTIVANRSQYVDFTFTESGVSMIVPFKDDKKKSPWVFVKPLSWDLWVTTACFFLFIGFVIWVLEHRINDDFRGPPEHQVGTSFWFSFSTLVFAQRERVLSNMARFVVIVWCFVVLILTQSYTATLTSLLTVQSLQPTVNDVAELIKRGENVGYQQGFFVVGILKQLGFEDKNLLVYDSLEECDALFQNGTANVGIAAAFDEVPYITYK